MVRLIDFEPAFVISLPETYALVMSSGLMVHPSVSAVVLHGSRGLAEGYRLDSDIELSLIIDVPQDMNTERMLQAVLDTTLDHWQGPIALDLAVIFDVQNCGLKCFEQTIWHEQICRVGGVDCFGLYKTQKGFHGLVTHTGIQVRQMYPCLKIWQRR